MIDIKTWRSQPQLASNLAQILVHPTMKIALEVLYRESRYAPLKIEADPLVINALQNQRREGMTASLDMLLMMAQVPAKQPESQHPPGFAETALRDESAIPPAPKPVKIPRKKK